MWEVEEIESVGFELIQEDKGWCHFRGHGFDLFINRKMPRPNGNLFNFKSYKSNFKGNFRIRLYTIDELKFIIERTNT